MGIKKIVADAGLLLPEAGAVDLDKFKPDLWMVHGPRESIKVGRGEVAAIHSTNRGRDVGLALEHFPGVSKDEILFLVRRVNFIGAFTAGAGTTCGEWTRPVNNKGEKGFWKANPSTGVCPVGCDFCYLRGVPYSSNAIALNVGGYAEQIRRARKVRGRSVLPKIINLSETGGPIEWAVQYGLQKLIQAYTDATLDAGVIPYWLTKRAIAGVDFNGAHVGVSVNPWYTMKKHSPGASHPARLLEFLAGAKEQGASTVIRYGPIIPDDDITEHWFVAEMVHNLGLGKGRFTVDLLRYSPSHPNARQPGFELRAHKFQESPEVQRAHLLQVRDYFPEAHIAGCKLDPSVAVDWVREGIIQSFPCACWR